jgi:hypothetical protein
VLTGGTLVLLAAFTPWALLRMLPLHELASAAAGGLSQAPKQTLSKAADTAIELAGDSVTLGGAAVARRALAEGRPSIVGGGSGTARQSAADAGPELGAEDNLAVPVDPDVAEPVTSAMSGAPASDDPTGRETATDTSSAPDLAPGGGMPTAGAGGDSGGSATGHPSTGGGTTPRWPESLAFPEGVGDDDPKLPLGDDLRELADEQRSLPAADDDDGPGPPSARAADPPSPVLEPPMPPARTATDPRPPDPRGPGVRSEAEPPPKVAPPPDLGFDPFGGDVR